jgi:hypothetical protein
VTSETSDRGWWRRRKAKTSDVAPWPEDFLIRLNVEVKAVRRRHTKLRQVGRRLARKAD